MTLLEQAIFKTILYADLFEFPLTFEELQQYLIEAAASREELARAVNTLVQPTTWRSNQNWSYQLATSDNFYFLRGRERLSKERKQRERVSAAKIKKARTIARFLKLVPWVKMVAISGSLTMLNSRADDDIDFAIVTAKNRLWITRALVTFIISALRKRRRPRDRHFKDKICLNLYLTEDALESYPHDLYVAHEVVQLKPLWERDRMYEKFIAANQWAGEYLPNTKLVGETKAQKRRFRFRLPFGLFGPLEFIVKILQLLYMKRRRTTERISGKALYFHPDDCRQQILTTFAEKIRPLEQFKTPS